MYKYSRENENIVRFSLTILQKANKTKKKSPF